MMTVREMERLSIGRYEIRAYTVVCSTNCETATLDLRGFRPTALLGLETNGHADSIDTTWFSFDLNTHKSRCVFDGDPSPTRTVHLTLAMNTGD